MSGSSDYGQQYVKEGVPEISARGLLTGQCIYREGGQEYTVVAYYYDAQGNVVQRRALNHLGGYEKDFYAYTFSGKLSKHLHVHNTDGGTQLREVYTYEYDSNTGINPERLLRVTHKLNDGAEVTLTEYEYDWLNRRSSRLLHDSLYQESYTYNIRSWLSEISGTKFTQSLTYGNGTAGYNGNITATAWTANGSSHSYAFAYDGLNRLMSATHGAGRFTEKVTSYDKNGNILALQRYGQTAASAYGLIDNLTLTYNGNQLTRADDAVTASAYGGGFEFKDAVKQVNEYTYDANGNLTKDLNKNISSIQYNCLNLPSVVTFGDGSTITYTYTADGTKLRTVHQIGGTTTTTDYCGDVIYENGVRKLLLTEVGYITLTDNQYHYYLQDHLGNNRVVLSQTGTIEEETHYYPFGGIFSSPRNVQPYKYNSKEHDDKKGLNWYDYGARHYDAALGRFLTVDPMAEKYYSWSPYVYCKNSPVNRIDPNGKTDYRLMPSGQIVRIGKVNDAIDRLFFEKRNINVSDKGLLSGLTRNMGGDYYRRRFYQETNNLQDAVNVFKFAADHTSKEWKLDVYQAEDGSRKAVVATDMHESSVSLTDKYNDDHAQVHSMQKVVDIHSHPDKEGTKGGSPSDKVNANDQSKNAVYHKETQTLFEYDRDNTSTKSIMINSSEDLYKYIMK